MRERNNTYRQGDLLFISTDKIPETAKKVRRVKGRIVVALGEATGHAHAIADRHADLYELIDSADVAEMRVRFLHVDAEVALVHEEHHTVTLPPGDYEVRRQREYTPEAPRIVGD